MTIGGIPAGSGLAGELSHLLELSGRSRVARIVTRTAGVITFITGGIVGYYSVYSDTEDYENKLFDEFLLNNENWASIADQVSGFKMLFDDRSDTQESPSSTNNKQIIIDEELKAKIRQIPKESLDKLISRSAGYYKILTEMRTQRAKQLRYLIDNS